MDVVGWRLCVNLVGLKGKRRRKERIIGLCMR